MQGYIQSRRWRIGDPFQQYPIPMVSTDMFPRLDGSSGSRPKLKEGTYAPALGRGVDKLFAKVLPIFVLRSFLDNDLLVIVRELEDDVLVLLGELQFIIGGYAFLRNRGTAAFDLLVDDDAISA